MTTLPPRQSRNDYLQFGSCSLECNSIFQTQSFHSNFHSLFGDSEPPQPHYQDFQRQQSRHFDPGNPTGTLNCFFGNDECRQWFGGREVAAIVSRWKIRYSLDEVPADE